MRHAPWTVLTLAALLLAPATLDAQQVRVVKVDKNRLQVGFPNVSIADSGFKAGLWTPILIKFVDDEEGTIRLPVELDGSIHGEVLVECADNDNVLNVYAQKFSIAPGEPLQIVTYAKVASTGPEIRVTVKAGGQTYPAHTSTYLAIDVGQHLYLTLGDNPVDFHEALVQMNRGGAGFFQPGLPGQAPPDQTGKETRPRFAVYETGAQNLPAQWFGYNAVDLAILVTTNEKFLDRLLSDRQSSPQLQALAEWVGRGGRLVVSVSPNTREKVQRLLASPAWQPALPAVLTAESKTYKLTTLNDLLNWSNAIGKPLPARVGKDNKAADRLGVRLQQTAAVYVECWEDQVPLIVRFPHGLGCITVMGFDVKDPFLSEWNGRHQFWEQVVKKLAPESSGNNNNQVNNNFGRGGGWESSNDITSQLYQQLEMFDTPTISFGWVVLFIFIYILVVGPVDYIILKLLFKRLELTWLTFPAVVLTVSLLAYFTAYAIKGKDLKVNKIDLVDMDLRTALGDDFQPSGGRVYGTTWFTVLSPRIQNYTIGLEPVLYLWQPGTAAPAQPIEPTLSWLGRPEGGGMGASGRGRSPSLFTRSYNYAPNAAGLRGVPIPVWTTKSFTASWEAVLDRQKLPLESKLTYAVGNQFSLTGTIKNNLPFDLLEVGLIYRGKYYPLTDLEKGKSASIVLGQLKEQDLTNWTNPVFAGGQWQQHRFQDESYPAGAYDPTQVLRNLMFHERIHPTLDVRNHAHRNLDFSWRLKIGGDGGRVKEAILVARVKRVQGPLEQLHADNDLALPTHLWLGELPGTPTKGSETRQVQRPDGKVDTLPAFAPRPTMQGNLVQDTYIRVILPVAPEKK